MSYARHIGRLGALAVALGVGYAVATSPGIAYALPSDSSSASSASDSSSTSTSSAPGASSSASPSAPAVGAATATGSGGTGTSASVGGLESVSTDAPSQAGADGSPSVVVSSSGGAQTAADGPDDTPLAAGDDEIPPVVGEEELPAAAGDEDIPASAGDQETPGAPEPPPVTGQDPEPVHVPVDEDSADQMLPSASGSESGVHALATERSTRLSPPAPTPPTAPTAPAPEPAAVTNAPAAAVATVPLAAATLPPPPPPVSPEDMIGPWLDLEEALEEFPFHVGHVLVHLTDAVLELLLAPTGLPPGSLAWAVLAFARDEFNRMFNPAAVPAPLGTNLLVNGDAESGDPSLSGYSGVTVPGWELIGTPTVIQYGTLRRFPSPTASPGPTLPAFLGFPSTAPPGGSNQFFGGGYVATSGITQTVDLNQNVSLRNDIDTGTVQYTLSGLLGGFFIDPSSTTVTVNFLGEDQSVLGTGTIGPVSALDRWFMTGLHERGITGTIPEDTYSAQVIVTFTDRNPILGNYNNAYADNLSFTISSPNATPAPLTPPPSNLVGQLDHIFLIYLENKGYGDLVGSPNAPYLNILINQFGFGTNYFGLTHPSDPNYTPVIGGSDFGFNYNCPSNCFDPPNNLVNNIEAAGLTWAGYSEGASGYQDAQDRLPFLAFSDIYNDPIRVAQHLFNLDQLADDLASNATAPNFAWISANGSTDMEGPVDFPFGALQWLYSQLTDHQYNIKAGDEWLQDTLPIIFNSPVWNDPTTRSMIIVTFDEDADNLSLGLGNEGNHIPMIVIPSQGAITAGMRSGHFVVSERGDHYNLLRTIEDALRLEQILGPSARLTNNDRFAFPMSEYWLFV